MLNGLVSGLNASGETAARIGTFLKLPRREVVDTLADAGFDFAICDMEHGQVSEREACDVILAGRAVGLPVVVRVSSSDSGLMNRLLEWGAEGIQVPHIQSIEDAAAARGAVRYPPAGHRSASLAQPAAQYGRQPAREYLTQANERTVLVGQLETTTYQDDLEGITACLDIAFIGTFDLSIHAGHPGDADHPDVRSIVDDIQSAANRTGTTLGAFAATAEACRRAIAAGCRYIAYSSDLALLASSARNAAEDLAALRERSTGS